MGDQSPFLPEYASRLTPQPTPASMNSFSSNLNDYSTMGQWNNSNLFDLAVLNQNYSPGDFDFGSNTGVPSSPNWMQQISGGTPIGPDGPTIMQSIFGGTTENGDVLKGFGGPAFGLAKAGLGGYLGFRNMKNAEDTLDFQKNAFSRQFDQQATAYNNEIARRDSLAKSRNADYESPYTKL